MIPRRLLGYALATIAMAAGCTPLPPATPRVAPPAKAVAETYVRGVYAYQSGNHDAALADLQAAIAANPQLIMPRMLLGAIFKQRSDYRAAAEQYEKLVQLDPYFAENHYNLGVSYQMIQRLRDAEKSYLNALKLEPANFGANMNLGLVYLTLGEVDKAVQYTELAARLQPQSAEAMANLGAALDAKGDYPRAEQAYRKSLELAPYQSGTLLNYANNLLAQRKAAPALAVLEQAEKIEATAYVMKRKGDALAMDGKLAEALGQYEASLTKNAKYYAAMNETANVLIQQYKAEMELDETKRDRALALWHESLQLQPNQPSVKAALQEWEKKMFSN
jgi:superkiller protein 3